MFCFLRFVDHWPNRDVLRMLASVLTVSGSAVHVKKQSNNASFGYFNHQLITFIACLLFLLHSFHATKMIIIRNEWKYF